MAAPRHFLTLDGLRGVCAIAVLLFHRRTWAPDEHFLDHAYLAVDFFFALSGFVLAHAYGERFAAGMSFRQFATIRLVRLYPLLFLGAAAGAAFLSGRYLSKGYSLDGDFLLATICGLLALPTFAPIPIAYVPFPVNGPSWSLFFELSVNAVYALVASHIAPRILALILFSSFIWLAISAAGAGGLGPLGHEYGTFIEGAPRTLFSFFAGVLVYTIHARPPRVNLPYPTVILSLLLICAFAPNKGAVNSVYYDLACVAFLFPCVLFLGAICGSGENRWGRLLGELSYPIYILHVPLIYWFEAAGNRLHIAHNLAALLVVAALCVALSALAWKFYDQPLRKFLSSRLRDGSDRAHPDAAIIDSFGRDFVRPTSSKIERKATT